MNNIEKFILDTLSLMMIPYSDFLNPYFDVLLNIPDELDISHNKLIFSLEKLKKKNIISISKGYCYLTVLGFSIWEKEFEVNWDNFYDLYFETIDDNEQVLYIKFANEALMQDLCQLNLYNFNICVLKNNSAVYLKSFKRLYEFSAIVPCDYKLNISFPKWKKDLVELI